jgi:acetate kinase
VKQEKPCVLAMNGGSSSIKFTLYWMGDPPKRRLHGKVDRIGLHGTTLTFDDPGRNQHDSRIIGDFDYRSAANILIDWLDEQTGFGESAEIDPETKPMFERTFPGPIDVSLPRQ